ncbi:MAG TPA: WG repeat-containing protein [Methanocorpusculum sp.]|nr:WG repeat-containing protein [Methanocorpusculum sp.]
MTVEINPKLTEAVQKYDWLGNFSEGLAWVRIADKWGYVDKNGNSTFVDR